MNKESFRIIADTLRQYRRADLKDFTIGNEDILERLYTDPLPDRAILKTIVSPNTTFVVGRKGTGKSTIFAMAQRELRKQGKNITAYIDVKALYDSTKQNIVISRTSTRDIDEQALQIHLIRKQFISEILRELINETKKISDSLNLLQRWVGQKKKYAMLMENLEEIKGELTNSNLKQHELPILQTISKKQKLNEKDAFKKGTKIKGKIAANNPNIVAEISRFDEALTDEELFREYTDVLLRSFPFNDIIKQISELLKNAGLERMYVFFDDFSELTWMDQRLFVDVILAPLNNTSNERIKLKIAAYPGRVYYGKIDPTKIDEIPLDFFNLYKSIKLPEIESSAIDYTKRLISRRFDYYNLSFQDYVDPREDLEEIFNLLFAVTINIPRVLGYILHYCYLDKISRGKTISRQAVVSASQRYYEVKLLPYFQLNRYSLEPYDQKLDRHNQKKLLDSIVDKAKSVKKQATSGQLNSTLFHGLTNPPTSHFTISTDMETILNSLEFNTIVSKYHQMRDKDGRDISVFALYYGLCASERMEWGYPRKKRYDKDYFKQRSFNFNTALHEFLANTQTIKCEKCGMAFPVEQIEMFKFYKWKCPECQEGKCSLIKLDDDFKWELDQLKENIMLESVELDILKTIKDEDRPMKAKEISALMDITYQLVGKRTDKLQEMGYVDKKYIDNQRHSSITSQAISIYFND